MKLFLLSSGALRYRGGQAYATADILGEASFYAKLTREQKLRMLIEGETDARTVSITFRPPELVEVRRESILFFVAEAYAKGKTHANPVYLFDGARELLFVDMGKGPMSIDEARKRVKGWGTRSRSPSRR